MDVDDKALDTLEAKVAHLEKLVYGSRKQVASDSPIIETILTSNTLLNAAANGHSNINAIYKRMDELNRDLSDSSLSEPAAETERKLNVILSQQHEYQEAVSALEKVKEVDAALNAGNLREIFDLKPELSSLVDQYAELRERVDISLKAGEILPTWHSMVNEVSMGLIAANANLADLEKKKLKLEEKKSADW